jgi:hypothetical protein
MGKLEAKLQVARLKLQKQTGLNLSEPMPNGSVHSLARRDKRRQGSPQGSSFPGPDPQPPEDSNPPPDSSPAKQQAAPSIRSRGLSLLKTATTHWEQDKTLYFSPISMASCQAPEAWKGTLRKDTIMQTTIKPGASPFKLRAPNLDQLLFPDGNIPDDGEYEEKQPQLAPMALKLLARQPGAWSLEQLAEQTGLDTLTIHRLLQVEMGQRRQEVEEEDGEEEEEEEEEGGQGGAREGPGRGEDRGALQQWLHATMRRSEDGAGHTSRAFAVAVGTSGPERGGGAPLSPARRAAAAAAAAAQAALLDSPRQVSQALASKIAACTTPLKNSAQLATQPGDGGGGGDAARAASPVRFRLDLGGGEEGFQPASPSASPAAALPSGRGAPAAAPRPTGREGQPSPSRMSPSRCSAVSPDHNSRTPNSLGRSSPNPTGEHPSKHPPTPHPWTPSLPPCPSPHPHNQLTPQTLFPFRTTRRRPGQQALRRPGARHVEPARRGRHPAGQRGPVGPPGRRLQP